MTFPESTTATLETPETSETHDSGRSHLKHAIEHAAHLLPAQGPITVFIHHNTLHAFEDMTFDAAVQKGARIFGCQPYLSEDRFRQELSKGRIREAELQTVLREDLGDRADEPILSLCTRFDLRYAMLKFPLRMGPDCELRWFVAETDALRKVRREVSDAQREQFIQRTRQWIMRDVRAGGASTVGGQKRGQDPRVQNILSDLTRHLRGSAIESWNDETWEAFSLQTLWRICRNGVRDVPPFNAPELPVIRHRDILLAATSVDSDRLVNDFLIRFCAAFLDQGFTQWHLPHRDEGFFKSFCALYGQPKGPPDVWLRHLPQEIQRLQQGGIDSLASIQESLEILGVAEEELDAFLSETLLALRGWAGMVSQVEMRSDSVAHPIPQGSLIDYLAVRLILERCALEHVAHETLEYQGKLSGLRQIARNAGVPNEATSLDQRAFQVFQLAQIQGWFPTDLFQLTQEQWTVLVTEFEAFSSLERRRVFQMAFERRFMIQTLDAIAIQSKQSQARPVNPRFQISFCLDEREESMRRHLEEVAPDVETFSAAGFYSVAMYYRGADDAHFVPLCPIVIRPQHWVVENVEDRAAEAHQKRAKRRRVLGAAAHQMHVNSRGLGVGALLSAGFGVLASIPLIARILFPRFTGRIRKSAGNYVRPPQDTKLQIERQDDTPGPQPGHIGFSVVEMTNIVERLLRDMGLTSGFARLVLIVGHGSNSLNNPHKSAYDCGACGGSAGGPNGRTFAQMANDPRVRANLVERGLVIPQETRFIGGFHNTCNDSITLFDTEELPPSHLAEFELVRKNIDDACDRNAHERCRRFQSASLNMTFPAARRHVEGRAEDLAQTRPECGHASNAICLVGRRSRTRGLFMDRRNFLTSYDPTQDDAEHSILARILAAAVPVCGGINLEYYFSYVDNVGFGCGAKLPHNVTSLLGVMDGAASDLRTGLPWQMVEIHEPVRLLFVVEATPETMLKIMDRNPVIGTLVRNGWVQMSVLSPTSSEIQVFQKGEFRPYTPKTDELPVVPSSTDWYRGLRDNLEFAVIEQV
ncbi:MAG: hypothetical protein JWM11_7505 [Planctomycetaceae bacterium]|nr:hypothetical protein [Planctomycetaceae bacterium]